MHGHSVHPLHMQSSACGLNPTAVLRDVDIFCFALRTAPRDRSVRRHTAVSSLSNRRQSISDRRWLPSNR